MQGLGVLRLGVVAKIFLATGLLLVALGGVVWVSVNTTRGATDRADAVHRQFAGRVRTDRALQLVTENAGLVIKRLSVGDGAVVDKVERRLLRTDGQLASVIGVVLDGGSRAGGAEAGVVARIRRAYPTYLKIREGVLRQAHRPRSPAFAVLDSRLDRAADRLKHELAVYADMHFRAGARTLEQVRRAGKAHNQRLAVLFSIAVLGLLLVLLRTALSLIENRRLLAAAQRSAVTDALTGLPNRELLLDRISQALARQTRSADLLAVLLIDLDDFKAVNDSSGHELGDRVLCAVSERLSAVLRRQDTIARPLMTDIPPWDSTLARLDGDEFVVLLEGLSCPADATGIADRLLADLQAPIIVDDHQLFLQASVGIALGDHGHGRTPIEFLRDAHIAMYRAKQAGKGRCGLFEPKMHADVLARNDLISDLRHAVSNDQLRALYQPQIDVRCGRMVGVEALVRWQHPERGLLTPDRFLPLAESTGMIVAIDDWVLREACMQLRAWDEAGLEPLTMAVNVSAHRLVNGDLANTIAGVLHDTATDPARLEIELTETVAVEPDSDAVQAIARVRDLGVKVAIDDFGMGYSALSRLQTFPVDRLKIDRSFITPLSHANAGASIVAAMIAMAHSLELVVVAEGVETPEHLAALRGLGCENAQGYLFSKPVAAKDIASYANDQAIFSASWSHPDDATATDGRHEDLIRNLLAELQRLTGLDSTYLTRIDHAQQTQHITHARNTATLDIPEGLTVDWSDTLCRRALDQQISYTDDVPTTFPGSQAAADLQLQTYITVPLLNIDGDVQGTLCGAGRNRVLLGQETVRVMTRFAALISQADDNHDTTESSLRKRRPVPEDEAN